MKTIKKDEVIKRVSDDKAADLARDGWSYTSKTEWKTLVRDINLNKTEKLVEKDKIIDQKTSRQINKDRKRRKRERRRENA